VCGNLQFSGLPALRLRRRMMKPCWYLKHSVLLYARQGIRCGLLVVAHLSFHRFLSKLNTCYLFFIALSRLKVNVDML
jgi:hypothetical protein